MEGGIGSIGKIPELRKRITFTLLMLAVCRIGVHIPTPGVDGVALKSFWERSGGSLFDYLNLFSGGALEKFSIFALGVVPYITTSIIFSLLTVTVPALSQLQKEGETGRRKINQWTRLFTPVLCAVQTFGISVWLESNPGGIQLVANPGIYFKILTMITLTAGTMFLMWIGEQITERGIGNGISLIIYSGIVSGFIPAATSTFQQVKSGEMGPLVFVLLLAGMVAVVGFVIFCERGQRRIPVHYAKRIVGRKMMQGQNTYLPLRINTAGVMPPIFASSLLTFPAFIGSFITAGIVKQLQQGLLPGGMLYSVLDVGLIIFFCYFYTGILFNPDDVADNLKKFGGYVPGIRPGEHTAEYVDKVLSRLTLVGAMYISLICVLPIILMNQFNVSFYFGGTSILIVVGVALDTVAQIESHLLSRNYEGLLGKAARIKGRRD